MRGRDTPFDPRRMSSKERQYHHVLEGYLERGVPYATAVVRAAQFANRRRGREARSGRGPKLVARGGSRRQWWPGKRRPGGELFVCLKHTRRFKTKSGWLAHFRGWAHAPVKRLPGVTLGAARRIAARGKRARRV